MTERQAWPDDVRAEALRLAEEIGLEPASDRTGVPSNTIRSWRSRAIQRAQRDAERAQQEKAGEEEAARLQAHLESLRSTPEGDTEDPPSLLEFTEAAARRALAQVEQAIAKNRPSDARNMAVTYGVLLDKASKLRAEQAEAAQNFGHWSGIADPRERMAAMKAELLDRARDKAQSLCDAPLTGLPIEDQLEVLETDILSGLEPGEEAEWRGLLGHVLGRGEKPGDAAGAASDESIPTTATEVVPVESPPQPEPVPVVHVPKPVDLAEEARRRRDAVFARNFGHGKGPSGDGVA